MVFAAEEDYQHYVNDLKELKEAFGIKIYAYCLMTNHVHLLVDPGDSVAALGQLMKALAGRATRYRNRLEGRTGTLWESRYKSSVVQTNNYLLACCRYIELNPVRACMVVDPADYPWSSYNARVGHSRDSDWLDINACFSVLGDTSLYRRDSNKTFVKQSISSEEIKTIREALQRGQLTGIPRFVDEVEKVAGIRIENRGRGRPRMDLEK